MANQNNNNQNNDNNNNNFFNNNPLLAFAIFSMVIIIIFKSFLAEGEGLGSMLNSQNISQTKQVKYSEIKQKIEAGNVKSVKITPSSIEAIAEDGGRKIRYIAQNVPTYDEKLIPLLEEKKITYEGVMGNGLFSELISMLLPILIFFGIGYFLLKKCQKVWEVF